MYLIIYYIFGLNRDKILCWIETSVGIKHAGTRIFKTINSDWEYQTWIGICKNFAVFAKGNHLKSLKSFLFSYSSEAS